MKKCPYCAEEIQDKAIKCKHCGEMLSSARYFSATSSTARKQGTPLVKGAGLLLLFIGLGTLLYFLMFYDTGVDVPSANIMGYDVGGGKVHNIGLMQNRQNGIIVGSVAATGGLACLLIGLYVGGGAIAAPRNETKLPPIKSVIYILIVVGLLLALAFAAHEIDTGAWK